MEPSKKSKGRRSCQECHTCKCEALAIGIGHTEVIGDLDKWHENLNGVNFEETELSLERARMVLSVERMGVT
jgi:hypothetical protein